jgi:flagellin-specific chaperone FliS
MARTSWFESVSGVPQFERYVEQMDSWQKAIADGTIELGELERQAQRVTDLMRNLEASLSDELHEELTQLLLELAVYYNMKRLYTESVNAEIPEAEKPS